MRADRPTVDRLTGELVRRDRAFEPIVAEVGPCTLVRRRRGTHFESLARAVCHQQLAGVAARAIHARFEALFDGPPDAEAVLALGEEPLRSVGLSGSKAAALLDLAEHVVSGRVRLASIARRDDEAIIAELTQVRGVGRWTAEMFAMFQLGRLDVWPVDDYGVRNGWTRLHGLDALPTPRELRRAGEPLVGLRSVAAWYCWRAVDVAASA